MKKSMQRSLALIMAVLMMFGAAPILGIGMIGMAAGDVVSISVLPGTLNLKAGDTYQFCAAGRDAAGNALPLDGSDVFWAISDSKLATLGSNGNVSVATTAQPGKSFVITAIYGGISGSSTVTIVSSEAVKVKSIGIVPTSVKLHVGQQFQLSALGFTKESKEGLAVAIDASDISWSSKNSEYVTVESNGVIKALKSTSQGVFIDALYKDSDGGLHTDSIKVYVDPQQVKLESISVAPKNIALDAPGGDYKLQVAGHGSDGKDYPLILSEVKWSSSNTDYVIVSSDGDVYAKAYTSNPIYVTASYEDTDGQIHSDSCKVTLKRFIDPVVEIIVVPNYKTIGIGDRFNMQAAGKTKGGNQVALDPARLSWASGDTTKVAITNDGTMTGLATTGPDGVKITATYEVTDDSGKVVDYKSNVATVVVQQKVDQIIWDWSDGALLAGETYSYAGKYKIVPSNASNKEVVLSVSEPSIIVEINQEAQTFKVLSIPSNETSRAVKLTLTAKEGSDKCVPADKIMYVYNDVPLTGVKWDLNVDKEGIAYFPFYGNSDVKDKNMRNKTSEDYWYEPTSSNDFHKYKYHTIPEGVRNLCTITVTSSDTRIMKIDMKTKRLIPVGNGRCTLKITATTPRGVYKEDYVTVEVYDSLYTPITNVTLYIDNHRTNLSNVEFPSDNVVSLGYKKTATFVPGLPQKTDANGKTVVVGQGTFNFDTFTKKLEDGRTITVYEALDRKWTTSDGGAVEVKKETDGAGTAKAVAPKESTITLILTDNNGAEPVVYKPNVKVKTRISPIQALWAILILIFTFQWGKVPRWAGSVC